MKKKDVSIFVNGEKKKGNVEVSRFDDKVKLKFMGNGFEIESEINYPFFSLADLREKLKEQNVFLMVQGSLLNVFPSRMTLGSFLAYRMTIGQPALDKDRVDILDSIEDIEIKNISTLEQQKDFRKNWIESVGSSR